jgi:hypothetical protein
MGRRGFGTYNSRRLSGFGVRAFHAFTAWFPRKRMRFEPQRTGAGARINPRVLPPCRLVATAVDLAMMPAAEWHGKLIAHFTAKRPWLSKA